MPGQMSKYAELHAHSAFTFLEGTCLPAKLVESASSLGLSALAVLDVDGMYSTVQTATAAANAKLPTVFGAELTLEYTAEMPKGWGLAEGSQDRGLRLPVLVNGQEGYHSLCRAISLHNLASPGEKQPPWSLEELAAANEQWTIMTGTAHGPVRRALNAGGISLARRTRDQLIDLFGSVVLESTLRPDSSHDLAADLHRLASEAQIPLVATGGTRCSSPSEQALADVMAASKLGLTLEEARPHLPPFGTFLRSSEEMLRIHRFFPEAVENAADLGSALMFDLSLIVPELPQSSVPAGHTDASWLRHLVYEGAKQRYGTRRQAPHAWDVLDHELQVIESLDFPGYFLIVKDIIDFCVANNIFAQGRGSAASSAVCYVLGVTAVDAVKHKLMFERFLSDSRRNPPDIDIDIEAQRREEVIQYVYERYGRERAAQVANTITYRARSAIRTAGGALGYDLPIVDQWSRGARRGAEGTVNLPPLVAAAAKALQKLPRHMGIHPGGMVLTRTPVAEICPVGWATKQGRTVLQWDKEDCADAGLVKFDLLGLGMLTALRKGFSALSEQGITGTDGKKLGLYNLPPEDKRVYELLCAAETVGVFQVESRAQMGTLVRMLPQDFYDLVIEVALIRPGPIQGQAVNPYLDRRRSGKVPPSHPLLEKTLERTLGIPIFQEQLMQIVIDTANFSAEEADQLRRSIGSKHSEEKMRALKPKLQKGMTQNGLSEELQEQIYQSLKGFAEFGFPESHAFSFAFLVYASAWLKTYYPEHFYMGLLASQPMGFYSPASLIADAKKHGVKVKPPSVNFSEVEATVEGNGSVEGGEFKLMRVHDDLAVRLGLDSIAGLGKATSVKITQARGQKSFGSLADFAERVRPSRKDLDCLARAGAFADLGVSRREAIWFAAQLAVPKESQPFLPGLELTASRPVLPEPSELEVLQSDWKALGLSVGRHPLELQRDSLTQLGVVKVSQVAAAPEDSRVKVAGLVTHRQRPGTARGVTFLSLEDETGLLNVVVSVGAWARFRAIALTSNGLVVTGKVERKNGAYNVQAQRIERLPLPVLARSRDFQ